MRSLWTGSEMFGRAVRGVCPGTVRVDRHLNTNKEQESETRQADGLPLG